MSSARPGRVRVRAKGGRTAAQVRWLQRQLDDPYVAAAKKRGYRARSVFKLEEIDQKHGLLRRGMAVLDLGAAPGSWTQYAVEKGCRVVACDLLEMAPVAGAAFVQGDFADPAVQERLRTLLGGPADIVLSDVAPNTTGLRNVDRLKAEAAVEAVLDFATRVLRPGGACLVKLLKGAERAILPLVRQHFAGYRFLRPKATRAESSELYLLATGVRPEPPKE
ncbi:MAG: ribosomal RNA large subunit methyltransferase E [Geminicoccaceae bacterium]|nr:MAG: ribosomal RNA large subunit methyltransferase E [Geminicoccaceae bacterium]